MPLYAWLYIFHPVLISIVLYGLVIWLVVARGTWRRYRRVIVIAMFAAYAVDTAIALPRILYAWRSPSQAVIKEKIALPARLVLIHAECGEACHKRLFSGELDEVILVRRQWPGRAPLPPLRYRIDWVTPGTCPNERRRLIPTHQHWEAREGFCPAIEPVEVPADGIFVVQENFLVTAKYPAAHFQSAHLTTSPPGATIQFAGVEVQRRTQGRIEVLAARRKVFSPGLTGLPPLVGCWARPDNIIWIMPPGDTKCGFWRWFTSGGDLRWQGDANWVFAEAFTPPDRPFSAPVRPQ